LIRKDKTVVSKSHERLRSLISKNRTVVSKSHENTWSQVLDYVDMHQESGHTSFPFSALTSVFRPKAVRTAFPLLLPALSTLGDLFHSTASAHMQLNSL